MKEALRWFQDNRFKGVDFEKPYPEKRKIGLYLLYFCAGLYVIFAIIMFSWGASGIAMGVVCLLATVGCILLGINDRKEFERRKAAYQEEKKAEQEKYDREHPYHKQEKFFQHCREKGISDISQVANFERVKLMAQAFPELDSEEKIRKAFLEGKQSLEEKERNAEREEKLKTIKAEEQTLYQQNMAYYGLQGREKPLAYCAAMIKECKAQLKEYDKQNQNVMNWGNTAYSLGKEKEGDWAILGGLASGIAGGAAGLATALDVQSKNAEKRERNAGLAHDIASTQVKLMHAIAAKERETKEELKDWQETEERAKLLLVDNQPKDQLFKMLNPTVEKVWMSDTGALHLIVKTSSVNFQIFENVKATVNGDFKAVLSHDGNRIGEVCFTLPYNGARLARKLEGLTTESVNQLKENMDYEIIFETDNLFAIEIL